MTKIETIKQIICTTIAANSNGADWDDIVKAVKAKYEIKNWLKEVRNPMQSLICADVIERTNDIGEEVYVFTKAA